MSALDCLEREVNDNIVDGIKVELMQDVLALITRLRAAEARTAWQPIETAPVEEWVFGRRSAGYLPCVCRLASDGVWVGTDGERVTITAWAPLPAASEAP